MSNEILLRKLETYMDSEENELKWFQNYVAKVISIKSCFQDHISQKRLSKHGVPQLFILHFNEIVKCVKHMHYNIEESTTKLNDKLNCKLKLNMSKTE